MEMGYNWYVRRPGETEVSDREVLRCFYGAAGSFIVYDCSGLASYDVLDDVLGEADMIYLVMDPLPTKLISSQPFAERIRESFPGTELVVNKYAKGIHRGELASFLWTRDYHTEPFMPAEDIYRAEYNCNLV